MILTTFPRLIIFFFRVQDSLCGKFNRLTDLKECRMCLILEWNMTFCVWLAGIFNTTILQLEKLRKQNAVIYYNDQFTANNWLLQGLRRGLIYSGQVLHTNEPVSLFLVRC